MKIIVISPPTAVSREIEILVSLFENGLETFHLRKPDFSRGHTAAYVKKIPERYHRRVVLHGHHRLFETLDIKGIHFTEAGRKEGMDRIARIRRSQPELSFSSSFHRTADVAEQGEAFDYVFLSPVFDSISKKGYRAAFDPAELRAFLKAVQTPVAALGGVDESRIDALKHLGFFGAAVLGAVWQAGDPLAAFMGIKQAAGGISETEK